MIPFEYEDQAEYWKTIIRDKRDAFRTYVSDPAIISRLDTLEKGYIPIYLLLHNNT